MRLTKSKLIRILFRGETKSSQHRFSLPSSPDPYLFVCGTNSEVEIFTEGVFEVDRRTCVAGGECFEKNFPKYILFDVIAHSRWILCSVS